MDGKRAFVFKTTSALFIASIVKKCSSRHIEAVHAKSLEIDIVVLDNSISNTEPLITNFFHPKEEYVVSTIATKVSALALIISLSLLTSGCGSASAERGYSELFSFGNPHSNSSTSFGTDVLETPIVHEIYNQEEQSSAEVLSVYNPVGNTIVTKSDDNNLNVSIQLIQTKNLNDIEEKIGGLTIHSQSIGDVIYFEPLYSQDTNVNYWRWIRDKLNANGIEINMEIQVPASIQEVRIFGEIGNIRLDGISAKIWAQTGVGVIIGENLSPIDTATFIVNTPSMPLGMNGVDISFANLEEVNTIIAGSTASNIRLSVQDGSEYEHRIDDNIETKYAYNFNSDRQVEYIREAAFLPCEVNSKSGTTEIVTIGEKRIVRQVIVE